MSRGFQNRVFCAALVLLLGALLVPSVLATDVISNGDFSGGTTGWTHTDLVGTTAMSSDGSYGNPSPSLKDLSGVGKKIPFEWYDYQNVTGNYR